MNPHAYIVDLPRPKDVDKIDITDFLRDNGKDEFDKLIKKAKTPLQLQIDEVAKEELDLIHLSDRLGIIKEKLTAMPQSRLVAHLDYLKTAMGVDTDFINSLKKEIKLIGTEVREGARDDEKPVISASFPELIDFVLSEGQISFLFNIKNELKVESSFTGETGIRLVPPDIKAIPFDILPHDMILAHQNDSDYDLYNAVLTKLKSVSVLPNDNYYHLCAVYVFFTYISESSDYYPYLWFHGLPERGKSRIVKALINLSYRGFYTETLNEAYIFRLADRFRITLAIDLYELSERAQKQGSHDLLLGRYERGMKIPRVNPDKPDFEDMKYYKVSGPTIFATNIEIPAKDPLQSRCIRIVMPEARGIYPNNNSSQELMELKARLLAFRGRHMGKPLPKVDKPISGRLGDIIHPLLCVSKLLPPTASETLYDLIGSFDEERKEIEAESLAGRIAQALHDLQFDVENGRIQGEKVREKINEDVDERFHIAPQTIGRELSAMGIKRMKSEGKMQVIFDQKIIRKIWARFIPRRDNLPNLPNLPNAMKSDTYTGEAENGYLPNLPEAGEVREEAKNNLPGANPYQSRDREVREIREKSPGGDQKHVFNDESFDEVTV